MNLAGPFSPEAWSMSGRRASTAVVPVVIRWCRRASRAFGLVVSDVQPLPTRRAQHICFQCQIIPTHPSRDGFTGAASQCLGAVLDTLLNGEAMETELGANR